MSIFKNILFLQDYASDVRMTDASGHSYAQGYGNHVASTQAFAPLGHAHASDHRRAPAPRRPAAIADAPCPAGACG